MSWLCSGDGVWLVLLVWLWCGGGGCCVSWCSVISLVSCGCRLLFLSVDGVCFRDGLVMCRFRVLVFGLVVFVLSVCYFSFWWWFYSWVVCDGVVCWW